MSHFQGSIPAIITPMRADGQVAFDALKQLVQWHVAEGSDALVVVGTTGESATLSEDEQLQVLKTALEAADGAIPIIAGVGSNNTAKSAAFIQKVAPLGCAAGLAVTPYYNKPSQEGLYQHFKVLSEASDLPIILYNVPGRTVLSLQLETILRLAALPGIIGIKEASGDIAFGAELLSVKPADFEVYSGDDATAASLILLGAQANISVTANVVPQLMHQLCQAALDGDVPTVRALNARLVELSKALFVQSNPIPVKWAVSQLGRAPLGYRLPLTPLESPYQSVLRQAMQALGLL